MRNFVLLPPLFALAASLISCEPAAALGQQHREQQGVQAQVDKEVASPASSPAQTLSTVLSSNLLAQREAYEAQIQAEASPRVGPEGKAQREAYLGQRTALGQVYVAHTLGTRDVCIVTHFTPSYESFALLSARNHQDYARAHGYPCLQSRGLFAGGRFINPGADQDAMRFGLSWQKLTAIDQALQMRQAGSQAPLCSWVMWVDADTLFTNFDRSLEQVMAPWAEKDVILAREQVGYNDVPINAGVFFVRNSEAGHHFVRAISDMHPAYKDRRFWEQDAVRDWALQVPVPPASGQDFPWDTWDKIAHRLRPDVGAAPQRAFNAFYGGHAPPGSDGEWQEGDFLAHLPNMSAPRRRQVMEDLLVKLAR